MPAGADVIAAVVVLVVVAVTSETLLLTFGTDLLSIKSLDELASAVVKPDVTAFVTFSATEDRSLASGITVSYTTVTLALAELDLLRLPAKSLVNIIINDTKRILLFDATNSRRAWKTADTSAAAAMYSALVVSDSAAEYVIVVAIENCVATLTSIKPPAFMSVVEVVVIVVFLEVVVVLVVIFVDVEVVLVVVEVAVVVLVVVVVFVVVIVLVVVVVVVVVVVLFVVVVEVVVVVLLVAVLIAAISNVCNC